MLNPPTELTDALLTATLERDWGLAVGSVAYRPVGFGSHHWEVLDDAGIRWFLTVDELEAKRYARDESLDVAFHRLRDGVSAARSLCEDGYAFAAAPVPSRDGAAVTRLGDRFGVALYPYIEGESFSWGSELGPEFKRAVLDMVIALHTAPDPHRRAAADTFALPHRDALEAALTGAEVEPCGPYAVPAARLVGEHAAPIRRLLARHDEWADAARRRPAVLTHGEPHPGNTMRTPTGWLLIDWDTALVAPPERDLWLVDPGGDGSVLETYADATGMRPEPAMLEFYKLRWDLADIAVDLSRFRRPHTGDLNDDATWEVLRALVESV